MSSVGLLLKLMLAVYHSMVTSRGKHSPIASTRPAETEVDEHVAMDLGHQW